MTTLIGAGEAARVLGVTKPTLYAYVSRGQVRRQVAVDGRTSLYDREQIEQLAAQRRRRAPVERPSIDVQIATAVTQLHDDSPTYRGTPVLSLLGRHHFEDVAEHLMCGELAHDPDRWQPDSADLDRALAVVAAADVESSIAALSLAARAARDGGSAADTARSLIALTPTILGGPALGGIAERLGAAWVSEPNPSLVAAIDTALILLADHELATSTLAVRVAASVRSSAAGAFATGLDVVAGPFHGGASRAAVALLRDAEQRGAADEVASRIARGERLPGFGHTVYRAGDPRFGPLLDAVRELPDPLGRVTHVDAVLAAAGRSIAHLPNVDLALGALQYVAGLPDDAPIFAIARIAGWAAHYDEELGERPVRFRGMARPR